MHMPAAALQPALLRRVDLGGALLNWNSMRGRGRAFAGSIALLISRLLILLYVIVYESAGQTRCSARDRTKRCVAANGAKHSAASCADGGTRQRALLSLIHVGTAGQSQATGEQGDSGLHVILRGIVNGRLGRGIAASGRWRLHRPPAERSERGPLLPIG